MPDAERDELMRERAYALIVGAIVAAQLEPDVDTAFRVADMVMHTTDPDAVARRGEHT